MVLRCLIFEMKVYKILHIPTGLYFKPSNGGNNLSKKGKIYPIKPSLSWISSSIRIDFWNRSRISEDNRKIINHFNLDLPAEWYHFQRYVEVPRKDWKIVEVE